MKQKPIAKKTANRIAKVAEANIDMVFHMYDGACQSGLMDVLRQQAELKGLMETQLGTIAVLLTYAMDRPFNISESKILRKRKCECGMESYSNHCPFCRQLLVRRKK